MMKELSLREIQLAELEILKKLDEICRAEGLTYYLYYGTLIGAIRHKGIIPWDDDIDVAMPRPDYDRLIEYCRKNQEGLLPLRLMHYTLNPDYIYPIARFCDSRYYVDYQDAVDYGLGLFVDIYPLDGWGNEPSEQHSIYQKFRRDILLVNLAGKSRYIGSLQNPIRNLVKFPAYLYAKLRGTRYFLRKLDNLGKERSYEKDSMVGHLVWAEDDQARIRKDLLSPIQWEFEGGMFTIPEGYDAILTQVYGDYMQLPPEDQRIQQHHYKAYLKEGNKK